MCVFVCVWVGFTPPPRSRSTAFRWLSSAESICVKRQLHLANTNKNVTGNRENLWGGEERQGAMIGAQSEVLLKVQCVTFGDSEEEKATSSGNVLDCSVGVCQ